MPAASQPGSRAGLIAAVVTFAILFFVSVIFAIVYAVDNGRLQQEVTDQRNQLAPFIRPAEQQSAEIQAVQQLTREAGTPYHQQSVVGVLLRQRGEVAAAITGQPTAPAEAVRQANATINEVRERVAPTEVVIPTGALTAALREAGSAILTQHARANELAQQLQTANQERERVASNYETQIEALRRNLDAAGQENQRLSRQVADYQAQRAQQIQQLEQAHVQTIETGRATREEMGMEIANLRQTVQRLGMELDTTRNRLMQYRLGAADQTMRRPDGRIIQVAVDSNLVWVDIGAGTQLSPGMTFEVYDRRQGMPPLRDQAGEDRIPAGKASIEITRVGGNQSEARITRTEHGASIEPGDVIANLVFNPTVPLVFHVYGDFDLNRDGRATPQEAEQVRRLIREWGGRVSDRIGVDVDFLVLGDEPQIPQFSSEELADPLNQLQLHRAEEARAEWEQVRERALELHIPVLNRTRFLYFTGYYTQAGRH